MTLCAVRKASACPGVPIAVSAAFLAERTRVRTERLRTRCLTDCLALLIADLVFAKCSRLLSRTSHPHDGTRMAR